MDDTSTQLQDLQQQADDHQETIAKLQAQLDALHGDYYKNNFPSSQDFQKASRFNTRLKIPHYDSLPVTADVGEIAESGGKLYICSAVNTWTVAGTQS